jgi:23S rRNA pseudouridine2605 synthase
MTFNDKPRRPGAKPFVRDAQAKPRVKNADARPVKAAPERPGAAFAEGAERISKVMARAGVASRRDIERMITEGRVKLNGVLLDSPVVNVSLTDKIEVDGMPIRGIERTRLWLYHKPAGLVTTNSDPEGRATVFDNLPEELPRVMSIGRLDINTEGLLLLTNDGGLARVLELPTTGWLRRYRVRAHGDIKQEELDKLKEGIAVDGVLYGAIDATLDRTQGSNVWITMGLREGKNREIKNVLGAMGLEVNRLIRISYGPFQLGELPESEVVEVRGRTLRDQLGPRLVEDAKANFDAPIYNAPAVAAEDDDEDARPERGSQREEWVKHEKPGDKRERALGRLDTRRDDRSEAGRKDAPRKDGPRKEGPRKDKARGDDDRPKRAPLSTPRRGANVWMAPGARPLGEKATIKAAKSLEKYGPSARGPRSRPGSDRPDSGPRVRVNRVDDADGEWIRASDPAEEKSPGFGRKRTDGDRPRGERPQADRPRGDRPDTSRPRSDKSFGDKPRGPGRPRTEGEERPRARPFRAESRSADTSRGERAVGDRPRGERPEGDRPRSDRPAGDRPARSFSDRPRSDRPEGGRPRGDKPFGGERKPRAEGEERPRARAFDSDRPRGAKPSGDRSYGDKPAGAKPAGRPSGGRPAGKSFGGKPAGKGFSGKPRGEGGGGGRPSGGAPRGGPRGKRG